MNEELQFPEGFTEREKEEARNIIESFKTKTPQGDEPKGVKAMECLKEINHTNIVSYADMKVKYEDELKPSTAIDYVNEINATLMQNHYFKSSDADITWVIETIHPKTNKSTFAIHVPLLAEYIRNSVNYIFVKSKTHGGIQRYIYDHTSGYYKPADSNEMKWLIKQFIPLTLQKIRNIDECLQLLYTDNQFYEMEQLDTDENIINFQNGILHLNNMKLTCHSPKHLCTIQIPSRYDPEAKAPVNSSFDYFLDFFTNKDQEAQELILQFMGVCISNVKGYRMKKSLFMVGKSNAGKSVLKRLTEMLLGSGNYTGIELSDLEGRFGTAGIHGKRLIGSSDMGYLRIPELKTFKKITGGDTIRAEHKNEKAFDFVYNGLVWCCCNELPKFGGDKGEAVFNRIMVIECNNVADKLDKELLNKLYAEREYIIKRALWSLENVIHDDYTFSVPEKNIQLLSDYKEEVNPFLKFMKECTVFRDDCKIEDTCNRKKFYDVYVTWCRDNNNGYCETKGEVKNILTGLNLDQEKKLNGLYYYSAFTLTDSTKLEYKEAYGHESGLCNPYEK